MISQIYLVRVADAFHQAPFIIRALGRHLMPGATAVRTYQLNQTLAQQANEQLRVGNHPGLHPLHLKTFEDVNRVVRMDGGQHQMAGHGGFYCRNGGIVVADFTVQDPVGVKTQCRFDGVHPALRGIHDGGLNGTGNTPFRRGFDGEQPATGKKNTAGVVEAVLFKVRRRGGSQRGGFS